MYSSTSSRASEWVTSSVMVAFSLILMLPGDTLGLSRSYDAFRELGFDETTLAVPMMMIGSMRMSALFINGRWRRSPALRLVGSILGAVVFSLLTVSFAYAWVVSGLPASTAIGTYGVLCGCDIFSAYRAGRDHAAMNPKIKMSETKDGSLAV